MSKPIESIKSIAPVWLRRISFILASVLFSAILISVTGRTPLRAQGTVLFGKTFGPDTIGPGSVSTLVFTINNTGQDPVTDLAFTDNLPGGVTIAKPANASTTCPDGIVSAPDGGSTITFSNGRLGVDVACTITVDVTASDANTYTNTSGNLTSSAGSHGTATDDLSVSNGLPGFTKSFTPNPIAIGSRSTLTFTINNSANDTFVYNLSFTDSLPPGLEVADPANGSTTCTGGVITALPGTGVINFASTLLDQGASCTASVDVTATGAGQLGNTTGELASSAGGSGKASAVLGVTSDPLSLIKSFTGDPSPPGGTTTLEFTINNSNRSEEATDITFTDDLDATLSGLVAVGLPLANPCGTGSQLTGTGLIALSDGNLPAEGSCTFSITLQVPAGAATGAYPNTTSSIIANVGGEETGSPATDTLFVAPVPLLTKSFTDDPVAGGGTVTLEFTLTNSSPTSEATEIAFEDELTTFLPYPVSATLPPAGFCGDNSSMSLTSPDTDKHSLSMTGGSLAASASCTFSVTLDIPTDMPGGTFTNITGDVTATIEGQTVTGPPATDDLIVAAAPTLSKSFTDDPTLPGDTVTLEFTLVHAAEAAADATAIAFTDDLDATLSGLTATGLPANDVCGAGSQLSGTTNLSFTGGSLAPGESCTFSVTLQVPAGAAPGNHINQTSNVTATVSGLMVTGNPAQDNLGVAGLSMTKSFTDDPAIPGDTVTLQFTISNTHPISDATGIVFTDDLNATLSGLTATGLPVSDVCGAGSEIDGTSLLIFSGGNLTAGTSCSFSITLNVPGGAASETYNNTTSSISANLGASAVTLDPATDKLIVSSDWLSFSKSFTDNPVAPGDAATLEFTITNLHETKSAASIGFTDDLDAALSGLAATGLPANNVCGTGSEISGTDLLTFSGGNLGPGASCTFSVTLNVPQGASAGTHNNTTGQVSGTIDGFAITGNAATDDLQIVPLNFAKFFGDSAIPAGHTVALEFTIENLSTSASVGNITFADDLDAVLSGLAATGLPANDVCGAGSELTGTSFLGLRDGSLEPGDSCTFSVTLQVPLSALPGNYLNTTSELLSGGISAGAPATATLMVEAHIYLPLVFR